MDPALWDLMSIGTLMGGLALHPKSCGPRQARVTGSDQRTPGPCPLWLHQPQEAGHLHWNDPSGPSSPEPVGGILWALAERLEGEHAWSPLSLGQSCFLQSFSQGWGHIVWPLWASGFSSKKWEAVSTLGSTGLAEGEGV